MKKVQEFQKKAAQIVASQKKIIINEVTKHIANFETIDFDVFTNEKPYKGEFKNKVFFTHNDAYRYNNNTDMSVENLRNSHVNYEDRGYQKGCATDLHGYLILRDANLIGHNFIDIIHIYMPEFKKSKNKTEYILMCENIKKQAIKELDFFVKELRDILNAKLRELTNCSLLEYLRPL